MNTPYLYLISTSAIYYIISCSPLGDRGLGTNSPDSSMFSLCGNVYMIGLFMFTVKAKESPLGDSVEKKVFIYKIFIDTGGYFQILIIIILFFFFLCGVFRI